MQEKSAVNQVRKVNGQWRLKVDSLNGARRKPLWIACQLWGCRGGREDEVKLFESGWKERYYRSKFGVDIKKDPEFPRK
eukprot:2444896-Rhodomonas_salina.3